MDCSEVRSILWPADALRVSDDRVAAALEHAEVCSTCERFLEQDRRVANLVRESVPRVRASRELRERLFTALARERAGREGRRDESGGQRRAIAAAVVVLAVGLGLGMLGHWLADRAGSPGSASSATAFAEDYLRRVVEQDVMATPDQNRVASFFARELGLSMTPPELPDFEIDRALICLLNGRRGGVVEYRRGELRLSYYLIPVGEGRTVGLRGVDVGHLEEDPRTPATEMRTEMGLNVATWSDGEHQHALVGNVTKAELRELARRFSDPRRL